MFAGSPAYGESPGEADGGVLSQPAAINTTPEAFIDLLAAEFFEDKLRLAQSRRVEAETARQYLALSQAERKAFREARKRAWSHMSVQEKSVLRGAKHPRFANLTEAQKQPFRQIALQDLGIVNAAPVALLDGEI